MSRTVRAAGFAVAAFAVVASAMWGGEVQAWQGDVAPVATHFTDHIAAGTEVSDLGLNDVAADSDQPALTGSQAAVVHATALAEQMVVLADSVLPQPRSLNELIGNYAGVTTDDAEMDCLANAVYFEARSEPLEGQLAVAEVVLNRTQSGRYPGTICGVVTQPAQFSFVRRGNIPSADRSCEAWRRAVAVARIAKAGASRLLPRNVLWYHADYVNPSWGRRLDRNTKIGLHIFYS